MNVQKPSEPDRHTFDFMLAEFETLRCVRSDVIAMAENRVSIFLAAASGGFVGLALLNQSSIPGKTLPLITGLVLASLLLLGFITFGRTIETHISSKLYARGLNRIRRYFVQLEPDLKPYLLLPTTDARPRFDTLGSLSSGGASSHSAKPGSGYQQHCSNGGCLRSCGRNS